MSETYKLPFEKIHTWHMAKDFAKRTYLIAHHFPTSEQFGLASQMKRASVSVLSNIAEGSARTSKKDQAYFSQLAYSSLMEVACQIQLAKELDFIKNNDYDELRKYIFDLSIKINALRRSQLK